MSITRKTSVRKKHYRVSGDHDASSSDMLVENHTGESETEPLLAELETRPWLANETANIDAFASHVEAVTMDDGS